MRRAILSLLSLTLLLGILAPATRAKEQVVDRINGIGLIDYSRKPTFKVGDWARYHVKGSSQMGMQDDYVVTVIISGEETFWGDPGFWVETWTDVPGRPLQVASTLMSYAIFKDSLAIQHMQLYKRKEFSAMGTNGEQDEVATRGASSMLKSRTLFKKPIMWDVDTVGVDTVITPKGTFTARKISIRQGTGANSSQGDSSMYNEVRENRMSFVSTEIPITHLVREDIETILSRRTWMIGRSTEGAPLHVRERGVGTARLIDFGHGLTPQLLPKGATLSGTVNVRNALYTRRFDAGGGGGFLDFSGGGATTTAAPSAISVAPRLIITGSR